MEISTLGLSASALQAQQTRIDYVGHDLANLQTPGFRALRPELVDMPADPSTFGLTSPTRLTNADAPTRGVVVGGVTQPDVPGSTVGTGAPLDVALPDGVYLTVQLPGGQTAYTRDGQLSVDAQGKLQAGDNYLAGNLRLQPGDRNPRIDQQGQVVVTGAGGDRVIGSLPLVRVANPEGMDPLGLTLLQTTPASGAAQPFVSNGADGIAPQALEASNVDMAREFTDLIRAQRAYQASTQLIRTWDELVGQTVTEIGQ